MAESEFIVLPLKGAPDIEIHVDDVTVRRVGPLKTGLKKVKQEFNPYNRRPRKQVPVKGSETETREETDSEWMVRIVAEMEEEYERLPEETDEQYDARVMELDTEFHFANICYAYICIICQTFNKPVPDKEVFQDCPLEKARRFCFDILQVARIDDPMGLFFPRQRAKAVEQSLQQGGD